MAAASRIDALVNCAGITKRTPTLDFISMRTRAPGADTSLDISPGCSSGLDGSPFDCLPAGSVLRQVAEPVTVFDKELRHFHPAPFTGTVDWRLTLAVAYRRVPRPLCSVAGGIGDDSVHVRAGGYQYPRVVTGF